MVVFTGLVVDKDLAPAGLDSLHLFPALQSSHLWQLHASQGLFALSSTNLMVILRLG
jgi:hypothetical protein